MGDGGAALKELAPQVDTSEAMSAHILSQVLHRVSETSIKVNCCILSRYQLGGTIHGRDFGKFPEIISWK